MVVEVTYNEMQWIHEAVVHKGFTSILALLEETQARPAYLAGP